MTAEGQERLTQDPTPAPATRRGLCCSPDDPATHAYTPAQTPAQEQGGVSGGTGTGQTSVTS